MLTTLNTAYTDTSAADLAWALGREPLPALASLDLELAGAKLQLRLLGASHQVLLEEEQGSCSETVACIPGSNASSPRVRRGRSTSTLASAGSVRTTFWLSVTAFDVFDWTRDELLAFITANDIPINPLHAKGFASIGCAPCTRAIAPGEPERAGRWWWEDESKKECGLHVKRA